MRAISFSLLLAISCFASNSDAPPHGADVFLDSRQASTDVSGASRSMATAYDQYRKLAVRFNRELAGRYPFGELSGADAPLEAAHAFFIDYTEQAEVLKKSLVASNDARAPAALMFLAQLDKVSAFLRSSLSAGGVSQSLKLTPSFRALPEESSGSEQVVAWVLRVGERVVRYPSTESPTLDWTFGQALTLDLLWAADSVWRPSAGPDGADFRVEGSTASFGSGGEWALLRLIEGWRPKHVAQFDPVDPRRVMLEFEVPLVQAANSSGTESASEARMYLGLNLTGTDPGTKSPVAVAWPGAFPRKAPLQ